MQLIDRLAVDVTLLTLLSVCTRCCFGLRCYVGIGHKKVNSSLGLQSVDCSSQLPLNSTTVHEELTSCGIFYNPVADVAQFLCDVNGLCETARDTKTNSVCYLETRGSLHCCRGDMCNVQTYLYHLSPPQSATVCYSGTNNGSTNIVEMECPTSWCYSDILRSANGQIINETFGCSSRCNSSSLPPSTAYCIESGFPGVMHHRSCYCSTDRCNSKISRIDVDAVTTTVAMAHTGPVLLSMPNPYFGTEPQPSHFLTKFLVFSGGSAIVVLLLIVIAIVSVKYREQRRKSPLITYTQLTADLANEEHVINDDDDLLLAG